MAIASDYPGAAGASSNSALAFGGNTGPSSFSNKTEEWTAADFEIKTMTTS